MPELRECHSIVWLEYWNALGGLHAARSVLAHRELFHPSQELQLFRSPQPLPPTYSSESWFPAASGSSGAYFAAASTETRMGRHGLLLLLTRRRSAAVRSAKRSSISVRVPMVVRLPPPRPKGICHFRQKRCHPDDGQNLEVENPPRDMRRLGWLVRLGRPGRMDLVPKRPCIH